MMRREIVKKEKVIYPKVKIIKPVFWKECRFCGNSFRWEQGYEIEDYTEVNAHLFWSYCCNSCASSEKEVKKLVGKDKLSLPPPKLHNSESVVAEKVKSVEERKKDQDMETLILLRHVKNGCHERDAYLRKDMCDSFEGRCLECWISKLEKNCGKDKTCDECIHGECRQEVCIDCVDFKEFTSRRR
jgi:hypothetical protein